MANSTSLKIIGSIFLTSAVIGLFIGAFEYPIWKQNNDIMEHNEAHGHYSTELRELVRFQLSVTFSGILFGMIFLVLGLFLLWLSTTGETKRILINQQPSPNSETIKEDDDLIIIDEESAEICPRCNEQIEESWKRCPNCLLLLKTNCPKCNEEIDASWRACPHCGHIKKKKTIIKKV